MLVVSLPRGPSQPVPGVFHRLDDQRAEERGDFVAGQWDLPGGPRVVSVLGGGGDGEERGGEHGQGGPPGPGVPAADLVFIQPWISLARPHQLWAR